MSSVAIPFSEQFMLQSAIVAQEFKISVAFPLTYERSDQTYPVLYVLDAVGYFGTAVEIVRSLNIFNDIPEVLVIGIGYPVDTFVESLAGRSRDMTPTAMDAWYEETLKMIFPDAPESAGMGGAAKFLAFIRDELQPLVDSTYRSDPGRRILIGHSFGGLFALTTLFSQLESFSDYIIASPSIWWDDTILMKMEADYASQNDDLVAKVFLSAGLDEENVAADMLKMAAHLRERGYPSMTLTTHVFDGEIHMSVPPVQIGRGLRILLA